MDNFLCRCRDGTGPWIIFCVDEENGAGSWIIFCVDEGTGLVHGSCFV
jgi:hypothetical protein